MLVDSGLEILVAFMYALRNQIGNFLADLEYLRGFPLQALGQQNQQMFYSEEEFSGHTAL